LRCHRSVEISSPTEFRRQSRRPVRGIPVAIAHLHRRQERRPAHQPGGLLRRRRGRREHVPTAEHFSSMSTRSPCHFAQTVKADVEEFDVIPRRDRIGDVSGISSASSPHNASSPRSRNFASLPLGIR
jgi:hypothetical protein